MASLNYSGIMIASKGEV